MVLIRCCWMIVIVRRRPMVVIRVIVPAVLVDVQRRRHGRRDDQGLNEHECHDPAHGDSLLREFQWHTLSGSCSRWALRCSRGTWDSIATARPDDADCDFPWKTLTGAFEVCILPIVYET